MKYDCLIIDDEKELADSTCEYFNLFNVPTKALYDIKSAKDFFKTNECSLVLLDINLTDGSGFEFCKNLREDTNIPVLFVSARNTDDDKIIALNIGGDDFIEKPYSLGVLLAKVKVVLKRYKGAQENDHYNDGYLKIDNKANVVTVENKEIKLTSIEFKLLSYLSINKNRLITKQELFENVWNDKYTQDGTLNVHIRKIREQIEKNPNDPKYIITIWKEGYKFMGK
ncbi:MAG: response regulator transcription factor [Acholeplasmatales bacterium]|nr:response regulator transcription factor [Acholeplasmatales bacterium]